MLDLIDQGVPRKRDDFLYYVHVSCLKGLANDRCHHFLQVRNESVVENVEVDRIPDSFIDVRVEIDYLGKLTSAKDANTESKCRYGRNEVVYFIG
jgi:hypothetical protein